MPTPKMVLITTATMATLTVSRRAWTMSGSSRMPAQVVEAVGEGVLDDERQRPRHQEEQVGGDDEPEDVGGRSAAPAWTAGRAGRGRRRRGS